MAGTVVLVASIVASCGSDIVVVEPEAPAADVAVVVEANTAFALDLFRSMAASPEALDDNLTVGVHSVATVLRMLVAGASGGTTSEVEQVLHQRIDGLSHIAAGALDIALRARSGDGIEIGIANGVFVQDGLLVKAPYIAAVADDYSAGFDTVDFVSDPGGSTNRINNWVEDLTKGTIDMLLTPGVVRSDTRLVAVNAMYLEAEWVHSFDPGLTFSRPFTLRDGSTIMVPTMFRPDTPVGHGRGEGWEAATLSYKGDALQMLVIVPDDISQFVETLDPVMLASIRAGLEEVEIEVWLPRFEQRTNERLDEILIGQVLNPEATP